MITTEQINRILNITESFQLPERLLSLMLSDQRNDIFDRFLMIEDDLSFDWFTDYFQEEHSNRNAMMQDFTPRELAGLLPRLSKSANTILDICAGTGGLSIAAWNINRNAFFECDEISERALPLLLFNMAIRNTEAYIVNKNVLSGEIVAAYRLIKGDKYSGIFRMDSEPLKYNFDLVITNPPYSLRYEWKECPDYIAEYGDPPTKAADYAFILHGMNRLAENGKLCAILPHGVLFRAQKEGIIRENLIKRGRIEGVIGLPDKLFLNTDIPVCVLIISNQNKGIFFIDASREYQKETKRNRLRDRDVEKITDTFDRKDSVEKYARKVYLPELEDNGYNLNIPRYIDTYEKRPLPNMDQIIDDLMQTKEEIRRCEEELARSLKQVIASNDQDKKVLKKFVRYLEKGDNPKYEQLRFDLPTAN